MKAKAQMQAPGTQVVKSDSIDQFLYTSLRKNSSKFQELFANGSTPTKDALVNDVFTSFYTREPKLVENGPQLQTQIVQQLLSLADYQQTHATTQTDDLLAGIATMDFAPKLVEQLQEAEAKIQKRIEEAKNGETPSEELTDQELGQLRGSLRKSLKQTQEKCDQVLEAMAAWGIGPGEMKAMAPEVKLALADQLLKTPKLARVADLMGRFQHMARAAAAKTPVHGSEEIVDITIGRDLGRLLPAEIVKLIETPELFYADFAESKLMQYELQGNENLGKGPIIWIGDVSGSMAGSANEWSTAAAIAMMELARKQKRGFGLVLFSNKLEFSQYWDAKNPPTIADKLALANFGCGGGTNYLCALDKAFEMRASEPGAKPADFCFVTDGEYSFKDNQLQRIIGLKQTAAVRIFGVFIGNSESPKTLAAFSDQMVRVGHGGSVEVVGEALKAAAGGTARGGRR